MLRNVIFEFLKFTPLPLAAVVVIVGFRTSLCCIVEAENSCTTDTTTPHALTFEIC